MVMTFYGYILASAYKFYAARFNRIIGDRRVLAYSFFYTGFCQFLLMLSLLVILKNGTGIDLIKWIFIQPLVMITLLIIWMIGVSLYYTMARVSILIDELEQKTDGQKMMWGIIALLALVMPVAVVCIFKK